MFSKIFIDRPKFAFVISILFMLAGTICLFRLPVAEYPEIAPPTITVSAVYPGASSQVVAETVASVIEEQVNGIEDMMYFSSTSDNSGNYTLTLTFESGVDSDIAQVNVQNAVSRAESQLPDYVRQLGVNVAKRSTDMVCIYNFWTDGSKLTHLQLANYVRMNIKDTFARLPGVSDAEILGERNYSMRIWLDPIKLSALDMSPADVAAKIASQNQQAVVGAIGAENANKFLQYKLDTLGRLKTPEQFSQIVLRTTADGRQVTLGDIARMELGAENYYSNGYFNGKEAIAVALYRQDGANAVQLVKDANELLTKISERFPEGVTGCIGYDPTAYINVCIEEIALTLIITLVLVVAITWLFLQDWRATLVPAVAIPVSLFGTFVFMLIMGYSINVLTMFGMILVIGSLVDDAIVVVENTMRILETEHCSPYDAAVKSMQEITGAIIATTAVTVAIYAPIAFYGGMVGTIYKQFAVTMCIALSLSAVNALTLSPALSALILRDPTGRKKPFFFRWFDRSLDFTKQGYICISKFLIRRMVLTVLLVLAVCAANYFCFTTTNGGFLPDEDKGALLCDIELPPGAALSRTDKALKEFHDKVSVIPGIKNVITVSGFSLISGNGENIGCAIVELDDWGRRSAPELSIGALRNRIIEVGSTIPQAKVLAFQPPAIMGLGVTGGVTFSLKTTAEVTPRQFEQQVYKLLGIVNNKKAMPDVLYGYSSYNASSPQVYLDIDRAKAEALGVQISTVFNTLQSQLASLYVNDFNLYGYSFKVKLQVDSEERSTLDKLEQLLIRNDSGGMVPLSAIATVRYELGARKIERFEQAISAEFSVIGMPGVTSGKLMKELEKIVAEEFPQEYSIAWTNLSYQERNNEGKIVVLMLLAVVFGYLFLVAQYESWTVPLPVMLTVTFAILGGLLALRIYGMPLDIYAQLGLIMLIGISCKSAILMVEFSKQQREAGFSVEEAALNGANFRYRAVLMTAWSFIIGVFPLMFASGAGSESRKVIGTSTCWGMFVATVVGVAFIPPLYVFFQGLREKVKKSGQHPAA